MKRAVLLAVVVFGFSATTADAGFSRREARRVEQKIERVYTYDFEYFGVGAECRRQGKRKHKLACDVQYRYTNDRVCFDGLVVKESGAVRYSYKSACYDD